MKKTEATDASMGPRSIDRGFRGVGQRPVDLDLASMGPRSIDRGFPAILDALEQAESASMGPRSIDRGFVDSAYRQGP